MNSTVIGELEALVTEVENDSELRVFIITGAGRSLVASADISEQCARLGAAAVGVSAAARCSAASKSWRFPPSPQ